MIIRAIGKLILDNERIRELIYRNKKMRDLIPRLKTKFVYRPFITRLRVPIIAITGTNGKTTVARLLERIYLDAGYNVGTCTTSGVTHNGILVLRGDWSLAGGAYEAAKCPNVDLLVLETARGGMINYGIGFKKCQVGIVTNLYEDHLGFDGIETLEEMAEVKSSIPSRTDKQGSLILNGDDVYVRAMVDRSQANPIYFMIENDHRKFENVVFLKEDRIYKKIDGHEEFVMNAIELPITFEGMLGYNIANVMTTLAAVEGMKKFLPLKDERVLNTLMQYGQSPGDNPERFCMLTFEGERVILNFCKNPESYRREIEVITKIKRDEGFTSVVGVMTAPGNRREDYFKEISRLVASICDYVFVHPPKAEYLRGRSKEELVKLLSTNIPKKRILSTQQCSLREIISLSKEKCAGKTLYVVFKVLAEAAIDFRQVVEEAQFVHYPSQKLKKENKLSSSIN